MQLSTIRKRWSVLVALLLAHSLFAAACGGGDEGGSGGGDQDEQTEEAGTPTPGGKVTYALEA